MPDSDVSFRLKVAQDDLKTALAENEATIDRMSEKLNAFRLGVDPNSTAATSGGSSNAAYGAYGSAGSAPPSQGSAAGVAQASARQGFVPTPPPYAPNQWTMYGGTPPSGGATWGNSATGTTAPSGYPAAAGGPTAGGAAQAAQQSAGFNWANFPNSPANPNAYGPAAPGSQGFNSWQMAQQQAEEAAAQQRRMMQATFATIGVRSAAQGLGMYANNTASGDYDPMQGAALWGGALGATGGALAGALASPLEPGTGAAVGALAGQQLGSAALQAVVAPWVRQRNAELSLQSIAAREGQSLRTLVGSTVDGGIPLFPPRDKYGNPHYADTSRHLAGELDSLQESLSFSGKSVGQILAIKAGIYAGRDIISLPQISQTYATLASGLLAAGDDPADALSMTDRLSRTYYMGAPQMAARAAQVAALRNQSGGNRADMLLSAGPENYGAWADATPGEDDLTPLQRAAYGSVQQHQYRASRAASLVRGSGAAAEAAYGAYGEALATLPDGTESAAYAEANANRRTARGMRYGQEDLPRNLRMAGFEGDRARANYLPYSPGFTPRIALQSITERNKQIGIDESRYAHDLMSGEMGEAEQLRRFGQIQGLRTANARDIATINLGGEDRMMALSAGRPEFFARMDSERVEQTMLLRTGNNWNRSHGAANGQQLALQQKWMSDAGGSDMGHTLAPMSRTSDMNGSLANKEIADLLRAILQKMDSGGGKAIGGTRASEARGQIGALLDTQRLDPSALFKQAG